MHQERISRVPIVENTFHSFLLNCGRQNKYRAYLRNHLIEIYRVRLGSDRSILFHLLQTARTPSVVSSAVLLGLGISRSEFWLV